MKKTLFVMTHVGSGYKKLIDGLMQIPDVDFFNAQLGYHHPEDLLKVLHKKTHRKNDSLSIWCDVVLYNKDFSCKLLCDHSYFIYWHSTYEEAEGELLEKYGVKQAKRYYDFRTEGMIQYFKRSKKASWNPLVDRDSLLAAIFG